jgi:hypothetical protein
MTLGPMKDKTPIYYLFPIWPVTMPASEEAYLVMKQYHESANGEFFRSASWALDVELDSNARFVADWQIWINPERWKNTGIPRAFDGLTALISHLKHLPDTARFTKLLVKAEVLIPALFDLEKGDYL